MSTSNEGPNLAGDPSARHTTPESAPVGALGYAEASTELDGIIAELDRGVVDVDVLEDRLGRAVEIVEELDRRIQGARERVDAILPRLERVGRGADAGSERDD